MSRFTAALAASTIITASACAAINTAPGSKNFPDIAYVQDGTPRQKLDLVIPPSADKKPLPLIVYIHGGAWLMGTRAFCPFYALTKMGYAVASVDYRLSTDAIWPAQIDDCRAAMNYLAEHAADLGIDRDRVFLVGDSAGGHLALMLGLAIAKQTPAPNFTVRGIVDYYGPTDLTKLAGPFPGGNPVDKLLGGKVENNLQLAAAASPVTYVDKNSPPVLVLHGDRDGIVPVSQSYRFADVMRKAGANCELVIVHRANHGGAEFQSHPMVQRLTSFLERHNKP